MAKHKNKLEDAKKLEQRLPAKFPEMKPLPDKWKNGVDGWYIRNPKGPGLYTMDIEHVPEEIVEKHNDPENAASVASCYRTNICIHNCPFCFNEENAIYKKMNEKGEINRILTLRETMNVIDQAMAIAEKEGHRFESVKFLGPGELLMNPALFEIIDEYTKRGIILNIFTKGALLGNDELAVKYQGHAGIKSAMHFVQRLAEYENVGLLFSFQSFNQAVQDRLVTSVKEDGSVVGLLDYTSIRNRALENLMASAFYENGITQRVGLVNAPIVPENIDESFEIYRFGIEHGTPVIMTPTMVSGKGVCQMKKQLEMKETWYEKLVELYSDIYVYNVRKGIQTLEQIEYEGIASYVGAEPCNQVALGLYLRANGIIQMCPGRFDRETLYGNVLEEPLARIWERSPNRQMGITDPHNLVNNRCPAKDARTPEQNDERAFPFGFYAEVMKRFKEKLGKIQL